MSPNKYRQIQPQCEKCGSIDDLQVHHIDENRNNNKSDNLIVLCRSCHSIVHNRRKNILKYRYLYITPKTQMYFKFYTD